MEYIRDRNLVQAEREGRFKHQDLEYHHIINAKGSPARHTVIRHEDQGNERQSPSLALDLALDGTKALPRFGTSRILFQKCSPSRIDDKPHQIPFRDAVTARQLFEQMHLPKAYFQVAGENLELAHAHIQRDDTGKPTRFEMVLHQPLSNPGSWDIALSHERSTTSVFWSVGHNTNAPALLADLQGFRDHAFHPMLIPCIMFAANLRRYLDRRIAITSRLVALENAAQLMVRSASRPRNPHARWTGLRERTVLDVMFELLDQCRNDHACRRSQYRLWRSLHDALSEGFNYAEQALLHVPREDFLLVHQDLKQWMTITWHKYESLMAQDNDQVARADIASDMLHNLLRRHQSVSQHTRAKWYQRTMST